jgi:predicted dehydrogenase
VRLVAAADIDGEALANFGRHWEVDRLYRDYEEMLIAEKPHLVSVCNWDRGHAAAVRAAVRHGARAILCEKPLATDWREGSELVELCRNCGTTLGVSYQRRWERRYRRAAQFVREGQLGEIIAVNGYYVGGLRHNGCTWFNLARWLVGEIAEVKALVRGPVEEVDASLSTALHFSCGASGSLLAGRREDYSLFEIDILGRRGRIRFADAGFEAQRWEVADDPRFVGFRRLAKQRLQWGRCSMDRALHVGVQEMVDHLRGLGAPTSTGENAVCDLLVVEAVFRSAVSGRTEPVRRGGSE